MKLLTKELEEKFKKVGTAKEDPLVIAKFFTPMSNWTWYAISYVSKTKIFFGYVCGMENEFGYFSLQELEEINKDKSTIQNVERDIWFEPDRLSVVLKRENK